MIRHDDAIQIDRTVYRFKSSIISLQSENKTLINKAKILHGELIKLRNKPDAVYDLPSKENLTIKVSKAKINLDDVILDWNTRHFISYFQQKFKDKYDSFFLIKPSGWRAHAYRLKQFQDTHSDITDNQSYKDFIDWSFENKFTTTFIASIPLISSDPLLNQWNASRSKKFKNKESNWDDFNSFINKLPKSKKSTNELLKDAF